MKADCLSNLKGNELNAIKNYNVAQKLTPANVNLTLDKCWLLLRLRKLDEVEVELKSKIPPDQYNEKAFFILGEYYSLKQDYKKAIECYDKAIALNNRNQETFLRKGICLSRLQRVEEALKMLNFCIQLDPSQDEAFYERGLIDMN
jgi:tetratricopeptide (TPR) repeat protein